MLNENETLPVKILSRACGDGVPENTEILTFGKYAFADGAASVEYEETESGGYLGNTVNIDCDPRCITVTRKGSAAGMLVIEKDRKHYCEYGTPYGQLTVGVTCESMSAEFQKNGGHMEVCYSIDLNSAMLSKMELHVTVGGNAVN